MVERVCRYYSSKFTLPSAVALSEHSLYMVSGIIDSIVSHTIGLYLPSTEIARHNIKNALIIIIIVIKVLLLSKLHLIFSRKTKIFKKCSRQCIEYLIRRPILWKRVSRFYIPNTVIKVFDF